jgi:hypothetical protein
MNNNGWERWLHIGGSIASLAALGYLLMHLPRRGERVSVAGLSGLPTKGRVKLATARRALARLPRRAQECRGMTAERLREGMEIEREHRDITGGRVGQTAKIAAAHVCERPDYYTRIKRYVEG